MIAFIGNVNWLELMVVAVIAVIVFGRDLPHVAAKTFVQLQKLRRGVQQVWRETGISQEMRNLSRELDDGARKTRAPLDNARRMQRELQEQIERPFDASQSSSSVVQAEVEPTKPSVVATDSGSTTDAASASAESSSASTASDAASERVDPQTEESDMSEERESR